MRQDKRVSRGKIKKSYIQKYISGQIEVEYGWRFCRFIFAGMGRERVNESSIFFFFTENKPRIAKVLD